MQTYTLKVIEIKQETNDSVTLCFKQPLLKKIKYQAGQYLTISIRINNRRYIRPYSFSSSPSVDSYLEITIKRVPEGIVSNYIYDHIKVGDSIEAMQPMGDFTLPEKDFTSIFLWGVGSGITPLFSLIKFILNTNPNFKVNLIYGNRNKESTMFYEQLSNLEELYKDSLKVSHFHSQLNYDENLLGIFKGRINPNSILDRINKEELLSSVHFICGPIGLKEALKETLKNYNIANENIFTEDFELVKNPKDFENIETRNINLNFKGKNHILEIAQGKSILEAALDADLELSYSCQTGSCSTCKGFLKTGSLKMIGLSKERDDLLENEYLLCCSYPLNNEVTIEI